MKYIFDTNILVRFFTQDNEGMFLKSKEMFEQACKGKIEIHILESVLLETIQVLESVYEQSRPDIVTTLTKTFYLDGVHVHNRFYILEAFKTYETKNIDFVDAYIVALGKHTSYNVLSFEKKVNKLLK